MIQILRPLHHNKLEILGLVWVNQWVEGRKGGIWRSFYTSSKVSRATGSGCLGWRHEISQRKREVLEAGFIGQSQYCAIGVVCALARLLIGLLTKNEPMSLDERIDRGCEDRGEVSLGLESVVHGLGCSRDFGRIRTSEDHDRGLL